MLDLNRLFLFIAWLSPVVVLARTWRSSVINRAWRVSALAVLLITAFACLIVPRAAGYIGGGAWLAFLFLPAVGLRKAATLAAEEHFAIARRMVGALRFLHPARSVREDAILLRALDLAQRGALQPALDLLTRLAPNETCAGRQAIAWSFRLRGDWEGLLAWCRRTIPRVGLGDDPALLPLFFRSLGETGQRDELLRQAAGRASALFASPLHEATYVSILMLLLAFSGRTEALRALLKTRLRSLRDEAKEFWIATSEIAEGNVSAGRARLVRLRETTTSRLVRNEIAQRLEGGYPQPAPPLSGMSAEMIARFERNMERNRGWLLAPPPARLPPAVATFIALNLAMFLVEIISGGATNEFTLHKLGAFEPWLVLVAHQYWRLVACLFLHFGIVHLLFNLYALYVLGPTLERSIGSVRFAICYLFAGIGSSLGVLLLWRIGWTQADFLVGASGCVMGIVGAWAGWLLRNRHAPMARRRLTSLGLIVVMQTAFDYYTPQVSMAAHLSGLVSGVIIGLLIAPRDEP